jgi:hypothetical protein
MNWWNRNKRRALPALIFFPLFLVGVLIALIIFGPIIGDVFCTLAGCAGGISVELLDLPPSSSYQIAIVLPTETRTLTCKMGTSDGVSPFENGCTKSGAFFTLRDGYEPEEITVKVVVNGNQVSQSFNLEYEKFQPNGEDCPPTCYYAKIKMSLAE